jgi:hypothetical protein
MKILKTKQIIKTEPKNLFMLIFIFTKILIASFFLKIQK